MAAAAASCAGAAAAAAMSVAVPVAASPRSATPASTAASMSCGNALFTGQNGFLYAPPPAQELFAVPVPYEQVARWPGAADSVQWPAPGPDVQAFVVSGVLPFEQVLIECPVIVSASGGVMYTGVGTVSSFGP